MKNIFTQEVADEVIARIESLSANSQPVWGKMSVSQMLAHCSVTYEMVYTDKHPKPNKLAKFMLKAIVKKIVPGSAADLAGFIPNDKIIKVGDREVDSINQSRLAISQTTPAVKDSLSSGFKFSSPV